MADSRRERVDLAMGVDGMAVNGADPRVRPIGVLVVDAIPLFREGISALIARTNGLRLAGVTGNTHDAVALAEQTRPDVVVVDAVLDPRGILTRLLVAHEPRLTVLALVREPLRTGAYLGTALAAGTHGIALRAAEPLRLVDAIRRTSVERRYLDPGLGALTGGLRVRYSTSIRQPLSRREYQVLQLVAEGLENQMIAKELFVSVETVRTHVKNILRKLRARDRAHAVAVAFRLGVLAPHHGGPPSGEVPVARHPTARPLPDRVAPAT